MNEDTAHALDTIRGNIDEIDHQLVALLCERQGLVQRAAFLKKDEDAVRDPERVEEIISRVRKLAEREGASPEIVERVYRSMIESYINYEMREQRSSEADGD